MRKKKEGVRGIYAITNILTDTVYYGQSRNIAQRLAYHQSQLRLGKHWNVHLQRSWTRDGADAFVFAAVRFVPVEDLTVLERQHISRARSHGLRVFNIKDPEPTAPMAAETKAKIG